jgi:hypothetical protein
LEPSDKSREDKVEEASQIKYKIGLWHMQFWWLIKLSGGKVDVNGEMEIFWRPSMLAKEE